MVYVYVRSHGKPGEDHDRLTSSAVYIYQIFSESRLKLTDQEMLDYHPIYPLMANNMNSLASHGILNSAVQFQTQLSHKI